MHVRSTVPSQEQYKIDAITLVHNGVRQSSSNSHWTTDLPLMQNVELFHFGASMSLMIWILLLLKYSWWALT